MKTGRSLQELATELERQSKSKKDFLADTRKLSFKDEAPGRITLQGVNGGMELRTIAHGQIAASLGIPKTYYDRMLQDAPDLLATNANTWLTRQPARKLIRTLDGQVRAFLSDSYRPLDNHDLAEAVLPKLIELDAQIVSGEVTDSRLYLKAVSPRISGEVKKGDVVQAGVVVSNSEVGQGSLRVEEFDLRLVCVNGMIREAMVKKAHLGRGGRGLDALEDAREFFKDATRKADDRAFFLKVQDATGALLTQERLNTRLLAYSGAAAKEITADPVEVVELVSKRLELNEGEKKSVLAHLIRGADLSQWGLANAITRTAEDVEDYDRSTELEKLGGKVVELAQHDWAAIAEA